MISWIVASHNPEILDAVLRPSLELVEGDELVVVRDAPSIAVAYNQGTSQASHRVRCYVHHDVRITDAERLRAGLLEHCRPDVGMVGVIGSRTAEVPWWLGQPVGSVVDTREGLGAIDFGGSGPCAYLDGLLLATAQDLTWDEGYEGWHLYDHDVCRQQLAQGRQNCCLADGKALVRHEATSTVDVRRLPSWDHNLVRFRRKWPT